MNVLFLILTLLISIFGIYISYLFFKKDGLYIIIGLMSILAMILSLKIANIYGFEINIGIVPFISILTCLGILIQKYGLKDAKNGFLLSVFLSFTAFIIIFLTARYIPTVTDIIAVNVEDLIITNIRVLVGFVVSLIVSEYLYIYVYRLIGRAFDDIFISNTLAGICSSLIFSVILVAISYAFKFPHTTIMTLTLGRFLFSLFILIVHVPIMYYIDRMKKVK